MTGSAENAVPLPFRAADPTVASRRDAALGRIAAIQRSSAATLRSSGREREARAAERAASRALIALDEPAATARMLAAARLVREAPDASAAMERALEGAMSLLGADRANLQLRAADGRSLRIAAHAGFEADFLEYFAAVDDVASACGRAEASGEQVVVADVRQDPAFAPHRAIAAASRFRAVQSTPLVDAFGRVTGVLSTHFRHARRPSARDLLLIDWYAAGVAEALASKAPPGATAA